MILHVTTTIDGNRLYDLEMSGTTRERTSELQYAIRVMYKEIAAYAKVEQNESTNNTLSSHTRADT